jgi:hypothetical protein
LLRRLATFGIKHEARNRFVSTAAETEVDAPQRGGDRLTTGTKASIAVVLARLGPDEARQVHC